MKNIIVICGVSGIGKTYIGKLLCNTIKGLFIDADDYHSIENINKMKNKVPLNDNDRLYWLLSLHNVLKTKVIENNEYDHIILACSALKNSYRDIIQYGEIIKNDDTILPIKFVLLDGDYNYIINRLMSRKHHFMPVELLQSQYNTLEKPDEFEKKNRFLCVVDIRNKSGNEIVDIILNSFNNS